MKAKIIFAWYDIWIGAYWDKQKKSLYIFPVPMFGLKLTFIRPPARAQSGQAKTLNKLKKILTLLSLASVLFSCDPFQEPNKLYSQTIDQSSTRTMQIVKVDSCEYIYLRRFDSIALVHKGDCKHCRTRK